MKPSLIWPLDSPRVLTGNFGELRPNHFHTGLDFSTNGKENLQVYAIEEGFISRIRVSPVGYGKALYITHSNGKVSVYAHLNAFSLKIDKVLKEEQYAKKSYEVDFYPKPWSLFVRKNEIIGLSGNTGGSSGPHLHFELRDEKTEIAINPLIIYHVDDKINPVLQQVLFYDLSDTLHPSLIRSLSAEKLSISIDTLELPGSIFGLAYEAFDQYIRNGNHNNVYSAKIFLDNALIYFHELSQMDFSDFRYVNEFCDNIGHRKFQKCFLPGLFPVYIYPHIINKGRIVLEDRKPHLLRIELADETGNTTLFKLYLRSTKASEFIQQNIISDAFIYCRRDTTVKVNHLSLHFPFQCLYNDLPLSYKSGPKENMFGLGPSSVNLRSAFSITLKTPNEFINDLKQVVLKTEHGIVLPEVCGDSIRFNVKNFGSFKPMVDNTPPTVKTSLASKKRPNTSARSRVEFILADNLSGIGKYALFVNEEWVIAEYDAKSHLLFYQFEEDSPTGKVRLRLEVKDRVGNLSEFNYIIQR